MRRTTETEQLATMSDSELVAYYNVLTMRSVTLNIDPEDKSNRHMIIVCNLLTERTIPYQTGKLINSKA